jgi:hypothetical protein
MGFDKAKSSLLSKHVGGDLMLASNLLANLGGHLHDSTSQSVLLRTQLFCHHGQECLHW